MNNKIKALASDFLPPALLNKLRRLYGNAIYLTGDFSNWEEACAYCTGYEAPQILKNVLDATLKVKRGETAYERDSVTFDHIEYAWPLLAGLMWVAARSGGTLDVLDFGGALGSCYFQTRKFLESLPDVHWSVVEQPHFVEAGRLNVQDGKLRFYSTIKECLDENKPNVILFSGVLQSLKEPEELLNEVTGLGIDHLLIDRTSFTADGSRKRLYVQHVPKSIYKASYPIWLLNENDIIGQITSRSYELLESFEALDRLDDRGIWKGFIFCRTGDHGVKAGGKG